MNEQQHVPPKAGPFRGVPNALTFLRLAAVPFFLLAVFRERWPLALVLLAGAGITDIFDGLIARRYHQVTRLGSMMDPAADKLLGVSAYVSLCLKGVIPPWLGALVFTRDIAISLGALTLHLLDMHVEAKPTKLGKRTTLFQIMTIILALLAMNEPLTFYLKDMGILKACILVTAGFTTASGVHYLAREFKLYDNQQLLKTVKKPE